MSISRPLAIVCWYPWNPSAVTRDIARHGVIGEGLRSGAQPAASYSTAKCISSTGRSPQLVEPADSAIDKFNCGPGA